MVKKGWIEPKNLLVIDHQRYWLIDREMAEVKRIQKTYPGGWQQIVLSRMKSRSL